MSGEHWTDKVKGPLQVGRVKVTSFKVIRRKRPPQPPTAIPTKRGKKS